MDGKGNYKKRSVKQNIDDKSIGFKESTIIYAIDLDNYESNIGQKELNENIFSFCASSKFDVIWFYPNIEYVLVNQDVEKSRKRATVSQFTKNNSIQLIDATYLEAKTPKRGYSNILQVLDKYLQRK